MTGDWLEHTVTPIDIQSVGRMVQQHLNTPTETPKLSGNRFEIAAHRSHNAVFWLVIVTHCLMIHEGSRGPRVVLNVALRLVVLHYKLLWLHK